MNRDEVLIAYFRRYAAKVAKESGGSPFSVANLVYHAGQSMVNTVRVMLSGEPDQGKALIARLEHIVDECAAAIDPNWTGKPVAAANSQRELCADQQ